jgi:hypothetical protein
LKVAEKESLLKEILLKCGLRCELVTNESAMMINEPGLTLALIPPSGIGGLQGLSVVLLCCDFQCGRLSGNKEFFEEIQSGR